MLKRWTLLICLFLLLGVIVNIAVAWGSALFVPLDWSQNVRGMRYKQGMRWELQKWSGWAGVRLYSVQWGTHGIEWEGFGPDPREFIPHWANLDRPTSRVVRSPDLEIEVREAEARGLPLISMWSEMEWFDGPAHEVRGGFETGLAPWQRGGARIPRVLPARIAMPGFAINTIFYAAILWLLWFGPGMIRRGSRRRRGWCVRCGYDLRGSGAGMCSECGAAGRAS
jgi:hypothetical protein